MDELCKCKPHPRCVRLGRETDAKLRKATSSEAEDAGVAHSDRLLIVQGVEQNSAPEGGDLSSLMLLLEAPSASVCEAWVTAGATLLCPWPELLSPATRGSEAAVEVTALLKTMEQRIQLDGRDATPGTMAAALGPRWRRRIVQAYYWMRSSSTAVSAGSRVANSVAGAVDQLGGVPVFGAALALALFIVQFGALMVLAGKHDAIRVDVTTRCTQVLVLLLETTAKTLQWNQTTFS